MTSLSNKKKHEEKDQKDKNLESNKTYIKKENKEELSDAKNIIKKRRKIKLIINIKKWKSSFQIYRRK